MLLGIIWFRDETGGPSPAASATRGTPAAHITSSYGVNFPMLAASTPASGGEALIERSKYLSAS
jgi:hypothetical protein